MEISGEFPFAVKVFIDYLSHCFEQDDIIPGVEVRTKVTIDDYIAGRKVITIRPLPAGAYPVKQLSTRRLEFGCIAPTELEAGQLCERLRSYLAPAPTAHVCRRVQIVGEPARVDRNDEPTPRYQLTIDALMRERYDHLIVTT